MMHMEVPVLIEGYEKPVAVKAFGGDSCYTL